MPLQTAGAVPGTTDQELVNNRVVVREHPDRARQRKVDRETMCVKYVRHSIVAEKWSMRSWIVMGRPLYHCSSLQHNGPVHHVLGSSRYTKMLLPYLTHVRMEYVSWSVINAIRKAEIYQYPSADNEKAIREFEEKMSDEDRRRLRWETPRRPRFPSRLG